MNEYNNRRWLYLSERIEYLMSRLDNCYDDSSYSSLNEEIDEARKELKKLDANF